MLAFIPARGGSKGIPAKNLAPLAGKPLIVHTLEAAQRSKVVSQIFVSTDDENIAACCVDHGVAVPYRRPPTLATDSSSTADAILHGLKWMDEQGTSCNLPIIVLQPTSPLRTGEDIDKAAAEFASKSAQSLVSVHTMQEHPFNCVEMTPKGLGLLAKPAYLPMPRQKFPNTYFAINGAIYITTRAFVEKFGGLFCEFNSISYEMDRRRGIDIDSPYDLVMAEAIHMIVSENKYD
jgi:CMP-N,N'-diacetyllegionaminic acid synthase